MKSKIEGRWFWWPIDDPMPDKLTLYKGCWEHRTPVGQITRYQAMAYRRHWNNNGIYFSVKDGNYRWIDIHVGGDTDAFDECPD